MANIYVACPFCKRFETDSRGEGCCNCDHTGLVPIGENFNFKNEKEALQHDAGISYYDLKFNREHGLPLNYDPFK
jgi:hypothetical protein